MATAPQEYRPEQRKLPASQRIGSWATFYNSRAWRIASKAQLAREPMCRECGEPAACVDHIDSLASGGSRLDRRNLQSLCRACHARKCNAEMRNRGS